MVQSDMEAPDLVYAKTMTYNLACNWKVFNDNYLVCRSQSQDTSIVKSAS